MKPPYFFRLSAVSGRVEDDSRVEEAKNAIMPARRAPCTAGGRAEAAPDDRSSHAGAPAPCAKLADRHRQQQQRRREDRRDDARGVQLQRQVRCLALEHAVADLALRIWIEHAALGALHEDDERR